jgi:hypothetical protein
MILHEGDLYVRGFRMFIHFGGGDVDTGLPPMSFLFGGTLESPAMWITPVLLAS